MRLFVALDLPEELRRTLADLIARLRSEFGKGRWVRPEGMHITLKFIGETNPEILGSLRAALETVHSREPVQMNIRGFGFFPSDRRPHAAWCGVEASENLVPLAADVSRALEPLGIPAETRAFVPHLTLARFSSPDGLEKLVRASGNFRSQEIGSVRATEFHLYESILKPSGAEYKRLADFPFVVSNAALDSADTPAKNVVNAPEEPA